MNIFSDSKKAVKNYQTKTCASLYLTTTEHVKRIFERHHNVRFSSRWDCM